MTRWNIKKKKKKQIQEFLNKMKSFLLFSSQKLVLMSIRQQHSPAINREIVK